MRRFVRFFAIAGVSIIAIIFVGVAVIVPIVVNNAAAATQRNVTTQAAQQNAYALIDTNAGQVAYSLLVSDDWEGFCRQLGVASNSYTHDGVTYTTIRHAQVEGNIVLASAESSGNVYTIAICDSDGACKAVASFEPEEGCSMPLTLGRDKPTLYLTPIGAIYLGQTIGRYVSGTFE